MKKTWQLIKSRDENRRKTRGWSSSTMNDAFRFGLLTGSERDGVTGAKCLGCDLFFADWDKARAHPCPQEENYRKFVGRYVPSEKDEREQQVVINLEPSQYVAHINELANDLEEAQKEIKRLTITLASTAERLRLAERELATRSKNQDIASSAAAARISARV